MSNKNGHLIQAVCPFFQLALIMFPRHPISRIHRLYEDEGYEPLARVDGTGPLKKIRYYHNFQANGARLTWSRVQSSIATFKTFKGYFLQALPTATPESAGLCALGAVGNLVPVTAHQ